MLGKEQATFVDDEIVHSIADWIKADRSSATGLLLDESFKLGKVSIDEVDRDWESTSSVGVLAFSGERTSGGYSYIVKGKGAELKGGCMTEGSAKSFSMGSDRRHAELRDVRYTVLDAETILIALEPEAGVVVQVTNPEGAESNSAAVE